VLVLALLASGCGDGTGSTEGDGKGDSPAPVQSRSGVVTGRVLGPDGKPITVPGAKISVFLHGVSVKSGEKVSYMPPVGANGIYTQKVADGSYAFTGARLELSYGGQQFAFPLDPVGDDRANRDSADGIVQDYVWKLRGARPGVTVDENNHTAWYGASIKMLFNTYREDLKKPVEQGPAGTKVIFTLTPTGPLVDGSAGEVLTFTREYDPKGHGIKNGTLPDIPLGPYTLKVEEIAPDGTKVTLPVGLEYAVYGDSREIRFEPGSGHSVSPPIVGFTR
jgi:hypothetical protein